MSAVEDMFGKAIKDIRQLAAITNYDGRPYFISTEYDLKWKMGEKYRRGYICLKYAVAKILCPRRICEIGVCTGIGAIAMLHGSPDAEYVGIDNFIEEDVQGDKFVLEAFEKMKLLGFKATLVAEDSQKMDELPYGPYDLVHVDGCHTRDAARHDVMLAWRTLVDDGWILVDDGRDMFVAAGTFEAMANLPGGNVYWGYFEDTTGSILIHKRRS